MKPMARPRRIDVGLEGLVSKKKADFIGKRSLEQSYLKGPDRKQLVGLLTEEPERCAAGRRLCGARSEGQAADGDDRPGHLVLSCRRRWSVPSPWRSSRMAGPAWAKRFPSRIEGGKVIRAMIVDPVFYDKEGARQNV